MPSLHPAAAPAKRRARRSSDAAAQTERPSRLLRLGRSAPRSGRRGSHVRGIGRGRGADPAGEVAVALHEARRALEQAEHVLGDQHLAVARGRGADADRRAGDRRSTSAAISSITPSMTSAKAPASATARGVGERSWRLRPRRCRGRHSRRARSPPAGSGRHGRSPECRAAVRKAMVSAIASPPSSLTAAAPVSLSIRAALANACSGLLHRMPNGMSTATSACQLPRTTAAPCAHIMSRRDRDGRGQAVDHLAEAVADQQQVAMRIEQLRHPHRVGGEHDDRLLRLPCAPGSRARSAASSAPASAWRGWSRCRSCRWTWAAS